MAGHYGVGPNSSLVKWLIQESHPLSAKKACVREQVVFVNDPFEKANAMLFQKWIGQQLHTCVWNKVPLPNTLFHIFGTSEHAVTCTASFIVGGVTTEILCQLLVFKKALEGRYTKGNRPNRRTSHNR